MTHEEYVMRRDEILTTFAETVHLLARNPDIEENSEVEDPSAAIDQLFLEMVGVVDSNCMDCTDVLKLRSIIKGDE